MSTALDLGVGLGLPPQSGSEFTDRPLQAVVVRNRANRVRRAVSQKLSCCTLRFRPVRPELLDGFAPGGSFRHQLHLGFRTNQRAPPLRNGT